MIRNYLTIAWRNLFRNKVFSFINVTGLALGLTVGFLIYNYVRFERSYDCFHKDSQNIYRIPIEYSGSFASIGASATNHPAVGPALQQDFAEVESFTRLGRLTLMVSSPSISYEGNAGTLTVFKEERIYLADDNFLEMFSFPLLMGDIRTALKEPLSVVITESMAQKYFGETDPLGKQLILNRSRNLKVTGVLKDLPQNSHLQFDMLLSFSSLGEKFGYGNWTWPEYYNYIKLTPGSDAQALQAKLPAFAEKYLGNVWREYKFTSRFYLQPITEIHLKSNLVLEQDVNGSERTIYFLIALGVFVLMIAWINYINLSTAKSLERSKEVGLRKVAGASKRQLVTQFFFDALVVNSLAIVMAVVLLSFLTPTFENIVGKKITESSGTWSMAQEGSFWIVVFATWFAGTVIIGLYPAIILSSFNPAQVLKGQFYKSTRGIALRKTLVSFQYVLSIFLIAGTITIYKQLVYMQESDPGYARDQVLVVRSPAVGDSTLGNKISFFEQKISLLSAVTKVSTSDEIPGQTMGSRNTVRREGQDESENLVTFMTAIDDSFIDTYGINMAAGRSLLEEDKLKKSADWTISSEGGKVIINEDACTRLGFASPEEALHQRVIARIGVDSPYEIVGVVRNYHQVSLKNAFEPILYYYPPDAGWWKYISLRVNTSNVDEMLSAVKNTYAEAFPLDAFEYFFLDDHFNYQYRSDKQFGTIFGLFTMLGIVIACLGLFGLSVFSVAQRTREIGIRKVLGAPAASILYLFSKDSLTLLMISYLIALPLMYFSAQNWLSNFAFHIKLGWEIFILPPLLLMALSLLTIVLICIRAALANPVSALRHE